MSEAEQYIKELKNGKQIRIKYNEKNFDWCENEGWWLEELWCYDNKLGLFKCYYPISSYDNDFYTNHSEIEKESFLKESIWDSNPEYGEVTVADIIVEENCIAESSLSLKEWAIQRIYNMTDDEIRSRLS